MIGAYKKISKNEKDKEMLDDYLHYGQAKIVVKAKNEEELLDCRKKAE